jgi:hypothetical protein
MVKISNPPVKNRFLRFIGVRRDGVSVFAQFDIRLHGTNAIVASHYRPRLTSLNTNEAAMSVAVEPPLPVVFTVVEHGAHGARTINDAPGLVAETPLLRWTLLLGPQ